MDQIVPAAPPTCARSPISNDCEAFGNTLIDLTPETEDDSGAGSDNGTSSSDGAGGGPEQMWLKQARRLARQERRRRRAARAAKKAAAAAGAPELAGLDACYTIGERIGRGTYSTVSKCSRVATGAQRALKSIERKRAPSAAQLQEELEVTRLLGSGAHPHIVILYETFQDAKSVHLVLELCTGGELFDCIAASAQEGFQERTAVRVSRQVTSAILYMHSLSVAHRDVKPENFMLLDGRGIAETTIKVIDFGLSKRFKLGQYMTTTACTPQYVAPEVLRHCYTEACDLWSLGAVIFTLLCGLPPFRGSTEAEVLQRVQSAAYEFDLPAWQSVSEDARGLVRELLVLDFTGRATAQQVLAHRWLADSRLPQSSELC